MSDPAAFGRRLKQLRHEHGLTQEMLAERVGYAAQTIRKIEAGTRRPSYQMAAKLAQEFGIELDERAQFVRAARQKSVNEAPDPPAGIPAQPPAGPPAWAAELPLPLTRLIAREQELPAIKQLLLRDDVRLVTLVGPGGTGKTRLGLEAAASLVAHFAAGVVFVNLAPIRDPDLVVPTIFRAHESQRAGRRRAVPAP